MIKKMISISNLSTTALKMKVAALGGSFIHQEGIGMSIIRQKLSRSGSRHPTPLHI